METGKLLSPSSGDLGEGGRGKPWALSYVGARPIRAARRVPACWRASAPAASRNQGLGGGDQAADGAEGVDQLLVVNGQVADDDGPGAAALDGVALEVALLAQAEGRVLADAGQDGGGELGQVGLGEGCDGPVLAGDFSGTEEAEGLACGLDAPRAPAAEMWGRTRRSTGAKLRAAA